MAHPSLYAVGGFVGNSMDVMYKHHHPQPSKNAEFFRWEKIMHNTVEISGPMCYTNVYYRKV